MYIISAAEDLSKGAFTIKDNNGESVLCMFTNVDDANRYALQLEDLNYPKTKIVEVDDDIIIKTCEMQDQRYTVITPNDIVIPPKNKQDFV